MHKLIAAEGAKDGIEFDFAAIRRRPDTLDSHRLIRWAEAAGVQDEVVERLFIAYFENGEDIGDIRVLADIADLCGMDGVEVAELLESDTDRALVEREDQLAHEMGVTGVPAMIFGGKLAVSGAREPEVLAVVIDKALEMAGASQTARRSDEKTNNVSMAGLTRPSRQRCARVRCGWPAQRPAMTRGQTTYAASATTLLRPVRLARYSAWSARCSSASAVSLVAFGRGDADGDGDAELVRGAADLDRRGLDRLAQPLGDGAGKGHVGVGHHHHEFLAAIAAGQVDAAHIGGDAGGEFLQHLVADVMAIGVVDLLEEIDVHDDEGERAAVLLGAVQTRVSRWRLM